MSTTPESLGLAREELLTIVEGVRPELHRYCARLTGSVIEGEDIVQDTLAKALYALSLSPDLPSLKPWLFRIAHNAAMDFLKSHGRNKTVLTDEIDLVVAEVDEPVDTFAVRAALGRFLALPVLQRSAVILKDVLGHSLEETAETMGTTVMAVKAALVRGRTNLREAKAESALEVTRRGDLERYAELFNERDWDGVRAMLGDDCKLDLVSKSRRQGKAVGGYFGRYAGLDVVLRVVRLEEKMALAAFPDGAEKPAYFILLDVVEGRVTAIRDFRYVSYIANEAEYEAV